MSDHNDWMAKIQAENRKRDQETRQKIETEAPKIRTELLGIGVTRVIAKYDGSGDSGAIEEFECFDKNGQSFDIEDGNHPTPENLKDDILNILYDLMYTRHCGWELNEGSFGEFVWDLTDGTLKNTHNERIESFNTSEHEGW